MTRMEALYKKVRDGDLELSKVDYTKEMALAGMETVIAGQKFAEEMVAAQVAADNAMLAPRPPAATSQIVVKTEFLDQVIALLKKLENDQAPTAGE